MSTQPAKDIRDRLYNSSRGDFPDFYISAEDELYVNDGQRATAMRFPEHARYGRWSAPEAANSKTL